MAFALVHAALGVIVVERDGTIWRHRIWSARGYWKRITPRRLENIGGKGYFRVSLPRPGGLAIVMAHRLVWEMFRGRIPDGLEINHKDLNKRNNRLDNLEIVTGSQNMKHSYANGRARPWSSAPRPKLDDGKIAEARTLRSRGIRLIDIARRFGISVTHAHRITT